MGKLQDLTGRTFGRLTVMHRDVEARRTAWICRCTCGKVKSVGASNLVSGKSRSCGCATADTRRGKPTGKHMDITGQTYGRLTAMCFVHQDRWKWRCKCGKEVEARPSMVKAGKIKSCGCLQTELRRADIHERVGHKGGTCVTGIKSIMDGKLRSTNTTGHTGIIVRHNVGFDVYEARITYQGKTINLGRHETLDAAIAARKDAERKYFGQAVENYDNKK